jgi:hypothetical protein
MFFITEATDRHAYFFAENEDDERRLAVIENVLLVAGLCARRLPVAADGSTTCVEILSNNAGPVSEGTRWT